MPIGNAVRHLKKGEWQKAHAIVREDGSALGCWAHGIVHAMESDVENARYLYRRARRDWPERYDAPAELVALTAACKGKP